MVGTLKGYDQLMNLVLDDVKELLRGTSSTQEPLPSVPVPVAFHILTFGLNARNTLIELANHRNQQMTKETNRPDRWV